MDKNIKIALLLEAYDQASGVMQRVFGNATESMKKLQDMSGKMAQGFGLIAAGKQGFEMLRPAVEAFGEMQAAGNELKASMMGPGGVLNEVTYNKIYKLTEGLSDKYKGSTASYMDMVRVLKNNRIEETDVLSGIGEATAKLADFFQMQPAIIAEFSAHMKNDMGVAVGDMGKMMDLIARVNNAGVGKTGEEAVTQMNEFFSKVSIGLANLNVKGVEASKSVGALGALFMSRGMTGQSVGTNFRRIFDGMRDVSKMNKANEVAAQFGKHLELFDKQGNFKGIDNFVAQLGKLENLSPQAIAAILKPFGGKQGLSTDFLEYLAKHGLSGYNEYLDKINKQADLNDKLKVIMGGVNYEQGVMETSWMNLKAAFGAALAPALTAFYKILNSIITSVREFVEQYPLIAEIATTFIAVASAGLMLMGVIKVIQGIRIAFTLLNMAMAVNPFILIAMVAITAAILIYKHWDQIVAWFKKAFHNIAVWWNDTIQKIKDWWEGVINWFGGTGNRFYQAGKNIVLTLWKGIKSVAMMPVEAMADIVKKVREYLPFSPAKRGSLKDLHKVKLVETFAANIKAKPAIDAIRRASNDVYNTFNQPLPIAGNNSTQIHFAPVINLHGGATKQDADMITGKMKAEFERLMRNYQSQKSRVGY